MNTRTRIAQLALAAIIASPLVAFATQPAQGTTRAEVKQELQAFRANPVAADGYRWVGGEVGWAAPSHSYARVGGRVVDTDGIPHDSRKPGLVSSDSERARNEVLYRGK